MKKQEDARVHRKDARIEAAAKYRAEAEKADLDRELKEVAFDLMEVMTEALEEAVIEKFPKKFGGEND